jgi:hypothetical protein
MKRIAKYAAVIAAVAIVASMLAPKKAHGLVATAVQVVNTLLPVNTESAKTPFQRQFSPNDTYTVPAGQRLVVESVSGICEIEGNVYPYNLAPVMTAEDPLTFANSVMIPVYQGQGDFVYWFNFNQSVKLYGAPGTTVAYSVQIPGADSVFFCPANVSGYLIAQ